MSDLEEIGAFRNRLATFTGYVVDNYINATSRGYGSRPDPAVLEHMQREQAALTQEYGRLRDRIRKAAGGVVSQLAFHGLGVISQDVVVDAINRVDWSSWWDAVNAARQYLDLAIGHLQGGGRAGPDPDRFYRLSNPIYWVVSLVGLVLRASWLGRTLATVAVFLIAGLATGVLQDLGARLLRLVWP